MPPINYVAILAAAVAAWSAGAVWYGILGKQWLVGTRMDRSRHDGAGRETPHALRADDPLLHRVAR